MSPFARTRLLAAFLVAGAVGVTTPAYAVVNLGVDGAVVVPAADWSDVAGVGFGGLLKAELDLPIISATVRAGALFNLEKDGTSTRAIPVLVGGKFSILGPVYVAAEVGLVHVTLDLGEVSSGEAEFGATLGAGASLGSLDVRVGTLHPDVGEFADFFAILATVGWDFWSF